MPGCGSGWRAGLLSMDYCRLADAVARERVFERVRSGELGRELAVYTMMTTDGEWRAGTRSLQSGR